MNFMNKDKEIDVYYNNTVKSIKDWRNYPITWGDFLENFVDEPKQANITVDEVRECTKYSHMTSKELETLRKEKPAQWEEYQSGKNKLTPHKLVGCIVGGEFQSDVRKDEFQLSRNLMALDIDKGDKNIITKVEKAFEKLEYFYHTSFSHLPEKPKLRIYFPLKEKITSKKEYQELVEQFILKHGLTIESHTTIGDCDRASLKFNQVMFLPNIPLGGEYLQKHNQGELVNIFHYRQKEISMDNMEINSETDKNKVDNLLAKVQSPFNFESTSIIKRYCTKYNIHQTIKEFLSDIYRKESEDCYTYSFGSSTKGLRVYPDNIGNKAVFAYSHHGTDKLNDTRLHNSFDMLKIHLFNGDINKTIDFCKGILDMKTEELKETQEVSELKPISGVGFLEKIHTEVEHYKNLPVYKTGFDKLDKYLSGGLRKYLYVFGAGSSMGKTTFIQQLADNVAKDGNHVLFFSMEQTILELMSKSISRLTYESDKDNCLSHSEIMQGESCCNLNDVIASYKGIASNITYYEADMGTNVLSIEEAIKKYIEQTNKKPLVIIDYLQVLGSINDRDDTKKSIEKTVKKLKMITKQLEVPVIVLSSLNRDSYYMPVSYESFKETGGIEYTCDCLLGLQWKAVRAIHREIKGIPTKKTIKDSIEIHSIKKDSQGHYIRELELVGLKNRAGQQTTIIDVTFKPQYNIFVEKKIEFLQVEEPQEEYNPFKAPSQITVIEPYKIIDLNTNKKHDI